MNNRIARQFQEDRPTVQSYEKLVGCKQFFGRQEKPGQAHLELFCFIKCLLDCMLTMRFGSFTRKYFKAISQKITFSTVQVIQKF
jgi:hypothetical protein